MYYILIGKQPYQVDDLIEWGRWYEHHSRFGTKHVVNDYLEPRKPLGKGGRLRNKINYFRSRPVRVSTVFLAVDHNFFGGKPVLFESLVFCGNADGIMRRYHTWDEAVEGHKHLLGLVI